MGLKKVIVMSLFSISLLGCAMNQPNKPISEFFPSGSKIGVISFLGNEGHIYYETPSFFSGESDETFQLNTDLDSRLAKAIVRELQENGYPAEVLSTSENVANGYDVRSLIGNEIKPSLLDSLSKLAKQRHIKAFVVITDGGYGFFAQYDVSDRIATMHGQYDVFVYLNSDQGTKKIAAANNDFTMEAMGFWYGGNEVKDLPNSKMKEVKRIITEGYIKNVPPFVLSLW